MRIHTLALLMAALTVPRATRAGIRYDFEERFFQDPTACVADHALIRRDSLFHLFYTRGPLGNLSPARQHAFGHAVSPDLVHWTVLDSILPTAPGTWESMAHWAPVVIERPAGVFQLLYTGVDSNWTQQIGLATSTDLFTWTPSAANPVFHPDSTWSDWQPGAYSNCRDPALSVAGDTLTMIVTTLTGYGRGALGSAVSTDLVSWTDTGPIALTPAGPTSWHQLEAPAVSHFGGATQLYYGETGLQGIRQATAPALPGPWDLSTAQIVDYGAAAEITAAGDTTWFSRHTAYTFRDTTRTLIRFDLLDSTGGVRVVPASILARDWTATGTAFSLQPVFGDNTAARGAASAAQQGNGWIGSAELYQPLVGGGPGATTGDRPTGDLVSHQFVVEGDSITLRVGGGSLPDSVFVALCDACTDSILRRETGANSETMTQRVWETGSLRGQRAYLRIADHAVGSWGHINVDDIEELGEAPGAPPAIRLQAPLAGAVLLTHLPLTIAWSMTGGDSAATVSIDLSTDGGATWPRRLGTVPAADSSFTWTADERPTAFARFRLLARTAGGVSCCDRDSGNVTIAGTYLQRVTAASVTDTSFTVCWTTVAQADGRVEFGDVPELGEAESQPQPGPDGYVHAVTVTGLAPDKAYWYRVVSNDELADSSGTAWMVRTAQTAVDTPYVVTGTATVDGMSAAGAMVLAWLTHAGTTAWPLLAVADSSGAFSLDLGAARDPATGLPVPAGAGDSLRVLALVSPSLVSESYPLLLTGTPPQSLDSTRLVTGVGGGGARGGGSPLVMLSRMRPTPARGEATIAFTLAAPASVDLAILDARGVLVRSLASAAFAAGPHAARWDGRDAAGRPAPAGIYYAVARARGTRASARLVLLR